MHLFRLRLIVALIASVMLVSVASTYFDVLAHRHVLREDLESRTKWMGMSIQPDVQGALECGRSLPFPGLMQLLKSGTGALGLAIYDAHGNLIAGKRSAGSDGGVGSRRGGKVTAARNRSGCIRACGQMAVAGRIVSDPRRKSVGRRHGHHDGRQLHPQRSRRLFGGEASGALSRLVILIVIITFVMVRWFLLRPMSRVAERLRRLRTGRYRKIRRSRIPRSFACFSPARARSGDHGREPERGARGRRSRGPLARGRRKSVDRRATSGAHSQPRWFEPHFRGIEPRAVYARAARAGNRMRGAAQRSGDGA